MSDFRNRQFGRKVEQPATNHESTEGAALEPALRSDALASRRRILEAAAALAGGARSSMVEIAAAAGVGRSTLYRHFANRRLLDQTLEQETASALGTPIAPGQEPAPIPHQPPGQLGRVEPLRLEVTNILDTVPPHLVPDQLVAEARRAAGAPVALYVVDIDGSQLVRLAGSDDFPAELEEPSALGPEIAAEQLPELQARLRIRFPACVAEPLWLRGRVLGILLCIGTPITPLDDIAKQGAAALELANDYTDVIEAARRRKPTTAAAEIQQNLFPPRITRIAGAQLAGGLLPTYEVGGDWFDFVENQDGAWLAIADSTGTGATAAGLGAAALGSLRAARRSGKQLEQALQTMDETVRHLGNPEFHVTTLIARWHAATSTVVWVNCGYPPGYVIDADGSFHELGGHEHDALGAGKKERTFTSSTRRLGSGERLLLVSDGVLNRQTENGGTFGLDGIQRAVSGLEPQTAAATAMAILRAVSESWREPLEDDGTVVVLYAL
jgi:serine phosphatase RsbU (regulator of sigma subunit)